MPIILSFVAFLMTKSMTMKKIVGGQQAYLAYSSLYKERLSQLFLVDYLACSIFI